MTSQAPSDADTGRPYGGRSPGERRADRRRRLLDAALDLYGTAGYHATSVTQVCRAARVAPAKFYEEFTGSDDLLAELCREIWRPVRRAILEAIGAADPDVREMTRASIATYCHRLVEDERRARVLCIEFPSASLGAERRRRAHTTQFAGLSLAGLQLVTAGQARPLLDDRQLATLGAALVGAVQEALRDWLFQAPAERPPIDDVVDVLMTLHVAVGGYLLRHGGGDAPGATPGATPDRSG